jgi:hypothetical protein
VLLAAGIVGGLVVLGLLESPRVAAPVGSTSTGFARR